MSGFKIFGEAIGILIGVGFVVAGLMLGAEDPLLYIIGTGLVLWGVWDISKELRDSKEDGDVALMASERERTRRGE